MARAMHLVGTPYPMPPTVAATAAALAAAFGPGPFTRAQACAALAAAHGIPVALARHRYRALYRCYALARWP